MPTITFKAKPRPAYNMDNSIAYMDVKVPAIKAQHCDMAAFRSHRRYGSFANSNLTITQNQYCDTLNKLPRWQANITD